MHFAIKSLTFVFVLASAITFAKEVDPNTYAGKFPTIPKNARIAVLPMAYDFAAVPQEIPIVQEALINELKRLKFSPVKFKLDSTSTPAGVDKLFLLVNQAHKDIRSQKHSFLLAIKDQAHYDIAIIPAVVSRTAKLSGQMVIWDHVKQRLEIKGFGSGSNREWSGTRLGLSLEIDAYDSAGNWLFTSYGGISNPYIINTKEEMNELKPRLFDSEKDKELLQKGVEAALDPLEKKVKVSD
jgi:hypothetical protein